MSKPFTTPEDRMAELARIYAGMVKQEYFIMHRQSVAPERKSTAILEHFQWIVDLEKRGDILLTGGVFQQDGTQTEGLTIFRAESWDAAEALAASDPVVACGADSFRIERFRLGGGRFSVTIDFSDQTYKLS